MNIIVVDEHDNELGIREASLRAPGDIYRSASLWLTNSKGQVLMAQRAFSKSNSPGKWGPAASGTVEAGETYDTNIVKEIAEEIGLSVELSDLIKGPKALTTEPGRVFFNQWYLYSIDQPAEAFTIQEEEVEQVAWFFPSELQDALSTGSLPLLASAPQWMPLLLSFRASVDRQA